MIVKMQKLTLFIAETNVDSDLTQLGALGVVHLIPLQLPKDESIDRVEARIKQMTKALEIIETCKPIDSSESESESTAESANEVRPRGEVAITKRIIHLDERIEQLSRYEQELKNDLKFYQHWGDVSKKDLDMLQKSGLTMRLYIANEKQLEPLEGRDDIFVLGNTENSYRIAQISQADEKLDLPEVIIPKRSYDTTKQFFERTQNLIQSAKTDLLELRIYKKLLEDALQERIRRRDVRNAQFEGIGVEQSFRYWQGYFPVDKEKEIISLAQENDWGYSISDPTDEELADVPTLIKSPRWVERIKPVMSFMGLVPGYKELDVSKTFMIFFTFFAGILVGDAGYGLVFLLLTLFVHSKSKFKAKTEFSLIYTLSISIMVWGVLTGTYFGSPEIAKIPVLSNLIIDKLASFGGDNIFFQKTMFTIGAIHLSLAHLQNAWKLSNSIRAIGQLGWVAIVWGLFFVVNKMVLGEDTPGFTVWLFVGGAVLVSFFSSSGTNFFKGVISSFGSLPLNIISGFSDIISYIRLYAVALATVLMAESFNQMAIGDGITTVGSFIGAVIVLILGHALNMILAAMAVIVHGVRLNMLEYAGHAGVEFSGSKYLPFKLNLKKE